MSKSYECICGPAGSGKTREITARILDSLKKGKEVFLIVPEQEVMSAERRIADAADTAVPPISCEKLNVLSFRRLANFAFRSYGGISYTPPSEGAKLILMWQALEETAPLLKYYTGKRDRSLLETLLSAVNELKRNRITPEAISGTLLKLEADVKKEEENAARDPSDTKAENELNSARVLSDKLEDLQLIVSHYNNLLNGNYNDPSDDVTRLGVLLRKEKLFEGCDVYADSFNGFTGAETDVIRHAIAQANSFTVALCIPEPCPSTGFETVRITRDRLLAIAENSNIPKSCVTESRTERNKSYISPEFLKFERIMRSLNTKLTADELLCPDKPESEEPFPIIDAVRPTDDFTEAEYAAVRIKALTEKGAKYRDIAVVGRGIERFNGILDTTLSRFDIPYFISSRRPISETPLYHVIRRALTVLEGNWLPEDVMTYLKTGLVPISIDDINVLENYVTLWNVSGKRWTEDEWTMNPGGYIDSVKNEDLLLLDRLNAIRERVCDPLVRLSDSLKARTSKLVTLKEGCAAIYEFILNLDIPEQIEEEDQDEARTLYNSIMDMLDMLVLVGGELQVNVNLLAGILDMAADKTDYGVLPESMDAVAIGDAALLRAGSIKHVIMLGCIDGVFPRAVADDSFFSDEEKATLELYDLSPSPKTDLMCDDEIFYFYRAASSATHSLAASCPLQDTSGDAYQPSAGFQRISEFITPIPKNEEEKEEFKKKYPKKYPRDFPLSARLFSRINAEELYRENAGTDEGASLKAALSSLKISNVSDKAVPLCDPEAKVLEQNVKALYSKGISLTQYRLESFANCPFKYYAKYVLDLNVPKRAEFGAADVGNFIHRVMELAVKELFDKNGFKVDPENTDINALVEETVGSVVNGMLGNKAELTARLEALIRRLKRTSALLIRSLIEEFKESKFIPSLFEVGISTKEGDISPFTVDLSDKKKIHVYGKIDRVDTYTDNGKTYVRVIDYKTGSAKHTLDKIDKALDLQLLLYLFSIWRSDPEQIKRTFGKETKEIVPAGVLYQDSRYPSITQALPPETDEEAMTAALDSLERTGLVLNDLSVINAMTSNVYKYLPIKKPKSNSSAPQSLEVKAGSKLLTLDEIETLANTVANILKERGEQLRSGQATACPDIAEKPCEYCDYRSFCRSARN